MAERVIKDLSTYNKRRHIIGSIVLGVCFLFVSFTTFYGVRIFFPIVGSYGKGALNTLPASFTYLLPLFIFYMAILYIYCKSNKTRFLTLKVLGTTLIIFSIFNIVLMTIVFFLLLDGNIFFQTLTPMYPLDVFIVNPIYFLVGIACLLYKKIDEKYNINLDVKQRPFTKKDMVLAGFILPFATYFFGEILFCFIYIQEGYVDPNWYIMLPTYISFSFIGILCILYFVYHYIIEKYKIRFQMISLLVMYILIAVVGIWMIIGFSYNPYIISQSMQWEFEIGLAIKLPIGIFINFIFAIPMLIVATINLFKQIKIRKKIYESK